MLRSIVRHWPQAVCVIATMFAASSVFAAERFTSPAPGERLQSDDTLSVSWSIGDIGRDEDEMELVLSLDGGKTFPVRVTADLDPGTRSIFWRVPDLPTDHACLALRTGADAAPDEETIRLISETFSIGARDAARVEELFEVGNEWRTREAFGGAPAPIQDAGNLRGQSSEEFQSAPEEETPAKPPTLANALPGPTSSDRPFVTFSPPSLDRRVPALPPVSPVPLRE